MERMSDGEENFDVEGDALMEHTEIGGEGGWFEWNGLFNNPHMNHYEVMGILEILKEEVEVEEFRREFLLSDKEVGFIRDGSVKVTEDNVVEVTSEAGVCAAVGFIKMMKMEVTNWIDYEVEVSENFELVSKVSEIEFHWRFGEAARLNEVHHEIMDEMEDVDGRRFDLQEKLEEVAPVGEAGMVQAMIGKIDQLQEEGDALSHRGHEVGDEGMDEEGRGRTASRRWIRAETCRCVEWVVKHRLGCEEKTGVVRSVVDRICHFAGRGWYFKKPSRWRMHGHDHVEDAGGYMWDGDGGG